MAKKAKHEKEPNLERWLVSYADFITLLFAVFVMLYAMSRADQQKIEQVSLAIREAFGVAQTTSAPSMNVIESLDFPRIPAEDAQPPQPDTEIEEDASHPYAEEKEFSDIKQEISDMLAAKGAQDKINLNVNKRGLVISLKEAGFFDSGRAEIRPASIVLLQEIGNSIMGFANDVRIEGHTDNVPIKGGAFLSNWELSSTRSTTIVHYFIDTLHFPPGRLSVVGYGEYRPVADNKEESGRAKNRRVDIVLLSKAAQQAEPRALKPEEN
ncbi:MAG: OmpA family protein [Deltaproteobacteria bacterium]|nr:OmpA family protein [Deltaproteobacteria bacterium]